MLSIHTKGNRSLLVMFLLIVSLGVCSGSIKANEIKPDQVESSYDIVVYGGASGGIAAALQAKRMGKTVLLIEPGTHLGGLSSGGLGATDIGNKAAIGGIAREFYRLLGTHYSQDKAWTFQKPGDYKNRRSKGAEAEMWTFEPHVAEQTFEKMLADHSVPVLKRQRLDLKQGVHKQQDRIVSIKMESGLIIKGSMFIDATYEGDLMALSGVSYHVGRESNATYGETLNGIQTRNAVHHQFVKPVDPYVIPGDPESGLLPGVQHEGPGGEDGDGDHRVQAYCFRMCTTDVPENQREWIKPPQYDPQQYELLLRNFEAGDHRAPWNPVLMPNRKTDTNNNFAISTDNIGMNYEYPNADYQKRDQIIQQHLAYQQGLMWTLANHPRVPAAVRKQFQTWKPAKDEFQDTNGWPFQLYIREARRLVSEYVMTEKNCMAELVAEDSVGMGAYTMDSHNQQRYAINGRTLNEGDVQVGVPYPYPISYRSIRPKKNECQNLLVPVAMAASHIAYGSIRMEPVFMVLGQSAATAAAQAIDANQAVQDIDYPQLRNRLLRDKQVLIWEGPRKVPPIRSAALPGIIVDDRDAKTTLGWKRSSSNTPYVDYGYQHDGDDNKGKQQVTFSAEIPEAGLYEVRVYYAAGSNRATNTPYTVISSRGAQTIKVNQRKKPNQDQFHLLGRFPFEKGKHKILMISNEGTDGHVIVDALQLVPVKKN
ncbi:MAG: FAD-dependent oxidoreductase [Planctomycetes bacterium]|nr:FAD-dependent oxidoreductase [Planctomycetota bacterium]MCH9724309.1 FAD-dependent oxidoreductase [Planctomycetota bacterium]MCH9777328.1 FAD-dependent oxidoreductase [Planctomycetota bacterium]MCH9793610.1 FAD-dependent oxidoreductase [Planctomycetota bacterium]